MNERDWLEGEEELARLERELDRPVDPPSEDAAARYRERRATLERQRDALLSELGRG